MARFTVQGCGCEDYPCCGCGGVEVSTGHDAVEDYYRDQELDDEDFEDGDFDSAMASAGFGTDEDYGCYEEPDYGPFDGGYWED